MNRVQYLLIYSFGIKNSVFLIDFRSNFDCGSYLAIFPPNSNYFPYKYIGVQTSKKVIRVKYIIHM